MICDVCECRFSRVRLTPLGPRNHRGSSRKAPAPSLPARLCFRRSAGLKNRGSMANDLHRAPAARATQPDSSRFSA
eukprot:4082931-Pyramimonas_sp.AAC.1